MKRLIATLMGAVFALFVLAVSPTGSLAADAGVMTIAKFDSMATVKGAFLGAAYAIRGVPGAGLPWTLGGVDGELMTDGSLLIDVRGLVLADDPMVPAERRLTNPVEAFVGTVSCLTMDAMGNVVTTNVYTAKFPATMTGDAKIEAKLHLPYPCVAPIIFVTSPTGAWFAVTGR
jgi:hypothetical protein